MTIEILTPDKRVYEGEVSSVTVPGTLGSFQILKDHAPIISTLQNGDVVLKSLSGDTNTFQIKGGVIEVNTNKIVLLAEDVA